MNIVLTLLLRGIAGTTLGYLTPPNYIAGQPNYVTYGILGSTFAHEISHGFDISGKRHTTFLFFFLMRPTYSNSSSTFCVSLILAS